MMFNRRTFVQSTVLGTAVIAAGTCLPQLGWAANGVEVNDDGLHVQPWFLESFLDLREDQLEAKGAGKGLVVIWEQRGCPYCAELHNVNLSKPKISNFVKDNFSVLQLNLWGSRQVTDFDGEEIEERALARKWRVNFTPTVMFFGSEAEEGKNGQELEVARMPGYFKPFHFISMFEFVQQKAYTEANFQRFLQNKLADMKAKGIKADVW